MEDLALDEDGHGEARILVDEGLHVGRLFTLVETEPGVGGIFFLTKFIEEIPILLGGISMERLGRFPW